MTTVSAVGRGQTGLLSYLRNIRQYGEQVNPHKFMDLLISNILSNIIINNNNIDNNDNNNNNNNNNNNINNNNNNNNNNVKLPCQLESIYLYFPPSSQILYNQFTFIFHRRPSYYII